MTKDIKITGTEVYHEPIISDSFAELYRSGKDIGASPESYGCHEDGKPLFSMKHPECEGWELPVDEEGVLGGEPSDDSIEEVEIEIQGAGVPNDFSTACMTASVTEIGRLHTPPGDTIREMIEERDMSLGDLAAVLGRTVKTAWALLEGKIDIDVEMSKDLERAFNVPSSFWLRRQALYTMRNMRDIPQTLPPTEWNDFVTSKIGGIKDES